MLKLVLTFLVFASFNVVAYEKPALKLLPPKGCQPGMINCEITRGGKYYRDQSGRCGCLWEFEFLDMNTCRASFIQCDASKKEYYSTLMDKTGKQVGCGCFGTVKL